MKLSRILAGPTVGLMSCTLGWAAQPAPGQTPTAQPQTTPAEPAPTPPTAPPMTDADRIQRLEDEIARLRAEQNDANTRLNKALQDLEDLKKAPPAPPKPPPPPAAPGATPQNLVVHFDATARYDDEYTSDPINLLSHTHERIGAMRGRLYIDSRLASSLDAGLGVTTGGVDSPTVPFVRLGRQDRATPFSLYRAFFRYHPFRNFQDAQLTFGKMTNPIWRGDFAASNGTEMVWDNDVSPEGLVVQSPLPFLKTKFLGKPIAVQDTAGYIIFGNPTEDRFVGITRDYDLLMNQVTVAHDRMKLGLSYYDYRGLNSGLFISTFIPGNSADILRPSTDPFLTRPPLQHTNNYVGYGGFTVDPPAGEAARGSRGFVSDIFELWNFTGQYSVPHLIQNKTFYVLGDYVRNTRVVRDRTGYGVTLGARSPAQDRVGSFNSWFIWRDVAADAALSAFADSDLGAGTNYDGLEVGGLVRVQPNTSLQLRIFNFRAVPPGLKERVERQRIFFDVIRSF